MAIGFATPAPPGLLRCRKERITAETHYPQRPMPCRGDCKRHSGAALRQARRGAGLMASRKVGYPVPWLPAVRSPEIMREPKNWAYFASFLS